MISSTQRQRTLIVAEAGVNHNGSVRRALEMIDAAADAGADVVKFQTFIAKEVVSRNAPKALYQIQTTGDTESQLEMAIKLELDDAAHLTLLKRCRDRGIEFMSSPFDMRSLDFLCRELEVPCIKVGSGEITNYPFLLAVARTQKGAILSSGMSTLGEIEAALGVMAYGYICSDAPNRLNGAFREAYSSEEGQDALKRHVKLLHCTTEYPADFMDVNLRAMDTMRDAFGLPVGLSDHTLGIAIPVAAVARGAQIIEKHFTLDRDLVGPDHSASLDPIQLTEMVRSIREVELALGSRMKYPTSVERNNLPIVRRSLTASRSISKGDELSELNMTTRRPGTGVSASQYWNYLGAVANRDYREDEQIDHFLLGYSS